MAKRYKVPKKKDKRIFSKTANKTKKINAYPGQWRGGIML